MNTDNSLSRPACALIALIALTLASAALWGPWAGLLAFGLVLLVASVGLVRLPWWASKRKKPEAGRHYA